MGPDGEDRQMQGRAVRHRCEAVLADVAIPSPFDLGQFCQALGARRGRPIHLVAKTVADGPCGILLALADADLIFFEADTSPLHRDHIVLHEIGHVLCDHTVNDRIHDDVLRRLFPSCEPSVVHRILGRAGYTDTEEREAEMIATLVLERATRTSTPSATPAAGDMAGVLARLQATLGGRGERGR